MSKEDNQEIVDPIVLAAMIEDPNEDEEDKKLREQILGTSETQGTAKGGSSDDDEEEDEEDPDEDKDDKKDPKPKDGEEDEDQEDEEQPKPKKPVEAEDDPDEDEEEQPKTRKERRQQRQEDFLASIRKDTTRSSARPNIPNYNPLDYEATPKDKDGNERELTAEELARDREMYGAVAFAQGASQVKEAAEQDRFWSELSGEAKILGYDPELSFLNETTPDGKENPDFDPDKAEEVNAMYLQLCGAETFQARNAQGQPLFNPQTGQPIMMIRVRDTGISYEKFARGYVKRRKAWAEDLADEREDEMRDNITKQRKRQSLRPSGGKRKTLGAINPGDISRMSDEDFEKNEAEIDKQIDAMLGL